MYLCGNNNGGLLRNVVYVRCFVFLVGKSFDLKYDFDSKEKLEIQIRKDTISNNKRRTVMVTRYHLQRTYRYLRRS